MTEPDMPPDSDLMMLEALAAKAGDVFALTPPDAPGAVFAGALFSAGTGGKKTRFSAGAADVDPSRARRRCLGEVAETLAQFNEPEALDARASPVGLSGEEAARLEALGGAPARQWLPALRLGNGAASVPACMCLRTGADTERVSSLGCAAGPTRAQAARAALFELIERDAAALWWHGGLPAAAVADFYLDQAEIPALADALRQDRTHRHLRFMDLTADLEVPAAAAVTFDADGRRLALGFGAGAEMGDACRSALFEAIQMEMGNRILEMKVQRTGFEALSTADRVALERLKHLTVSMRPFELRNAPKRHVGLPDGDQAKVIAVNDVLAKSGIAIYCSDLSAGPDAIPVVKMISPQLQPLPMLWQTDRLVRCKMQHAARLAAFPIVSIV
jgi:ribosomal protein S12 methylthiotransferase accessory factor